MPKPTCCLWFVRPYQPWSRFLKKTTSTDLAFLPGTRVSLFDLGGMIMELRQMLGRDVDLRTPADLSVYFQDKVLAGARPLYAA